MECDSNVSSDPGTGDKNVTSVAVETEDETFKSNETVAQGVPEVSLGNAEKLSYHFSKLDVEEQIKNIVKQGSAFETVQRSNSYENQENLDSTETKIRRSKRRSRSSISEDDDPVLPNEVLKGKDVMRFSPYSTDYTKSGVTQGKCKAPIKQESLCSASVSEDLTQLISSLSPTKSSALGEAAGFQDSVASVGPDSACSKEPSKLEDFFTKGATSANPRDREKKRDRDEKQYKTEHYQLSQRKPKPSDERKRDSKSTMDDRSTEHGRKNRGNAIAGASRGSYSRLLDTLGKPPNRQQKYYQHDQDVDSQVDSQMSWNVESKNKRFENLTLGQSHPQGSHPEFVTMPVVRNEQIPSKQKGGKKSKGKQAMKSNQTNTDEMHMAKPRVQSAKQSTGKHQQQKQDRQPLTRDQYESQPRNVNNPQLPVMLQQSCTPPNVMHVQQRYGHQRQNWRQQNDGQRNTDQNWRNDQPTSKTPGSAGKKNKQKGQKPKSAAKQKQNCDPYWPVEAVSDGLKRQELIQGAIRINQKNFNEAYVPLPDGKSDIFICGLNNRNRALNGDIVAVQILPREQWRVYKDDLDSLEAKTAASKAPSKLTDSETASGDPDVIIESEEEVELDEHGNVIKSVNRKLRDVTIQDTSEPATKDGRPPQKLKVEGGSQVDAKTTPQKKYTSLADILAEGSPVAKQLFTEGTVTADKPRSTHKLLQMTGKIVFIIEKKHTRACTGYLKPMQDGNPDNAFFSPLDHRLPRIIIPMTDCPKGFSDRPDDHTSTLFVARIVDWREQSAYADGRLAKSLGEAGQIAPETEGILIENGVDFAEFPDEALEDLPKQTPWQIPASEFEYRRDFRSQCVFTIDPTTARDLDDALSCEDLGDGEYEIGVHIADVGFFLKEKTLLDVMAGKRATSVYMVQMVVPMLPRILCEQLCSLNPAEERLTFSVVWKINELGEITDEWFGRSVIKSCVKLSYDHAQGFIEEPDRVWALEELPPICGDFTVHDITSRVLVFNKIAQCLRKARFDSGALRLDQVKLQYSLDPDSGLPNGYCVYSQRDSNKLVEEFMLLANMAVAHKIKSAYPEKAFLRLHPEPQAKMADDLQDMLKGLGVALDVSSAGSIQKSLLNYYGDDQFSKARLQVLVTLCSKPMQNAKYFCTGCIEDEELYRHYALNVPLYTHFTSPIRRYADVIVHRMLASSLGYEAETSRDKMDIQRQASHCNDKKTAAKRVQDLSCELFFAVFVKEIGPLEEQGMVMGVLDKAFDVYILKLGVAKRVYCDQLPIREKSFIKNHKQSILTLYWSADEEHPQEVEQQITVFTLVNCILRADKEPLKWQAIIKHPD